MKIAFIILAYKNPIQIRILVEHLIHPNHHFFIHVDKNVNIIDFEKELIDYSEKVTWVKREKSYWGSYQCVKALLNGMNEAYHFKGIGFDYFIHLSGQDFPLKSPEHIQGTLSKKAPVNFFNLIPFPVQDWQNGGLDRLKQFKFFWKGKRIIIHATIQNIFLSVFYKSIRPLFDSIDANRRFYGGEFYFMLHRSGVNRLFLNIKKFPVFFNRLRYVTLPEEIIIPTMLMADASNIGEIYKDDSYRYIDWIPNQRGPKEMEEAEIEGLLGSKFLFGRKFNISSSEFKIHFNE